MLSLSSPTEFSEIKSCLEAIDKNPVFYNEHNVKGRIEAIDFIECQILDAIEAALQKTNQPEQLILLKHHAGKVKSRLKEMNVTSFESLRESIRNKKYSRNDLKDMIHAYAGFDLGPDEKRNLIGYDNLDIFLNGLLSFLPMPDVTKNLEQEMVYYQKTPGRIILELVEKSQFTTEDVFFDLGSGLGQVAILVNLLSGIRARGVEFEPAFCDYGKECARQLDLSNVSFINTDARNADYAEGTVFFLYTPFEGKMLEAVLNILKRESRSRRIRIFTYGPCTIEMAKQSWLDFLGVDASDIYKLGVFCSR